MINLLCVTQWGRIATQVFVNVGSCNDVLPDGISPLSESMLTYHQLAINFGDDLIQTHVFIKENAFELFILKLFCRRHFVQANAFNSLRPSDAYMRR